MKSVVVGPHLLGHDVVLVDAEVVLGPREHVEALTDRHRLQARNAYLDHEVSARLEMRRRVGEDRDLAVLGLVTLPMVLNTR